MVKKIKSGELLYLPDAVKNAIKIKEAFLYEQGSGFDTLGTKYVLELSKLIFFLSEGGDVTLTPPMTASVEFSKDEVVELED